MFHHFETTVVGRYDAGFLSRLTKIACKSLVYPFSAGHQAVILFFLLSGFVLSIPALNANAQPYLVFMIRRIFRIYLPYLAALMLALLGDMEFHGYITQSQWLGGAWSDPVDWHLVLQHIAFLGSYSVAQYDPPFWSLVYEMRISIVFPFLCAMTLKMRPAQSLACALLMSLVSIFLMTILPQYPRLCDGISTIHYASLFMVGIYLARQKESISRLYSSLSRCAKIVIASLAGLIYVYGQSAWGAIVRRSTNHAVPHSGDLLTALGAAGLIVFSLNSELCRRILLSRPVHALGEMSYSVYLLHFIVLLVLVHSLYGEAPLLLIFVLYLVAVVSASWVFYRVVERPFMTLGRRISAFL